MNRAMSKAANQTANSAARKSPMHTCEQGPHTCVNKGGIGEQSDEQSGEPNGEQRGSQIARRATL